jgi:MoaA/NifB/PqqE/SkfB family radical SAM enzyme
MLDAIEAAEAELGDFLDLQPRLSRAERSAWWQAGGGVHRPCLSLWHTLFLRPDGKVVPCGHLFAEPVGDAATDTMESLWQSAPLRSTRIEQRDSPFPICRRCCKQ